jgi:hypothetical protein
MLVVPPLVVGIDASRPRCRPAYESAATRLDAFVLCEDDSQIPGKGAKAGASGMWPLDPAGGDARMAVRQVLSFIR